MTGPWICWLYYYGIGGVLFFGALGMAVRTGAAQLEVARNRWLVALLLVGYFALATIHAGWIAAVTR